MFFIIYFIAYLCTNICICDTDHSKYRILSALTPFSITQHVYKKSIFRPLDMCKKSHYSTTTIARYATENVICFNLHEDLIGILAARSRLCSVQCSLEYLRCCRFLSGWHGWLPWLPSWLVSAVISPFSCCTLYFSHFIWNQVIRSN